MTHPNITAFKSQTLRLVQALNLEAVEVVAAGLGLAARHGAAMPRDALHGALDALLDKAAGLGLEHGGANG